MNQSSLRHFSIMLRGVTENAPSESRVPHVTLAQLNSRARLAPALRNMAGQPDVGADKGVVLGYPKYRSMSEDVKKRMDTEQRAMVLVSSH